MSQLRWIFTMAWRDSRSQWRRLAGVIIAVAIGVAALAAIHGLHGTVRQAVEQEASALLGSDAQITSRAGFSPADEATLRATSEEVAREISFSSMLLIGDGAGLVQVRALAGNYPFYGKVQTEPPEAWTQALAGEGVVIEPSLLDRFGASVGDRVRLGEAELKILGVFRKPLPRSTRFSAFAPELVVAEAILPGTRLLDTTSLVFHHRHLRLSGSEPLETLRTAADHAGWQMQRVEDRRDQLGGTLERFQQFLALIALAALVLGAVGVAGTVQTHVRRRIGSVAVLRCLGCPARTAFSIYALQAWALGMIGAFLGTGLGALLHAGAVRAASDLVPFPLNLWPSIGTLAATGAAGFSVCAAFATLPLLGLRQATPARALREAGAAADRRSKIGGACLAGGLGALAVWGVLRAGEVDGARAAAMTGGLALAFGLLVGAAWLAAWLARRAVRPGWPFWLRQGVAGMFRPGNQTTLLVLALGSASFLLCLVMLARDSLLARVEVARDPASPNLYLVDVQTDQLDAVRAATTVGGSVVLDSAPVVTMRIRSVQGIPSAELERRVPKWILQREFRSTYRAGLNDSERLLEGQWWDQAETEPGQLAVSLEKELARDLGVTVGDTLGLDIVGRPVEARITSLRGVDWSRFALNFFMVFRPGDLEGAPAFHLVTARVPEGTTSGALQRTLATTFPNVSTIDLALVLAQVREILGNIARVVEGLAWFTAAAGLAAIAAVIANGREERLRESVLLRTLGADRAMVEKVFTTEHGVLGLIGGAVGIVLAVVAHAALALWVFKSDPWPSPWWLGVFALGPAMVSVILGWWLGHGISSRPPLEELRRLDPGNG
ncbi:MAG: FtsX-like permease family protein [Verrucomicrobiia bacterium]